MSSRIMQRLDRPRIGHVVRESRRLLYLRHSIAIREQAEPQLQRHPPKDELLESSAALLLLVEDLLQPQYFKYIPLLASLRKKQRTNPEIHRVADPAGHRSNEANLVFSVQDILRRDASHRLAQDD